MSAHNQPSETKATPPQQELRVTTLISCSGVRPLSPNGSDGLSVANENRWFDRLGFRRRWYANLASLVLAIGILWAGVWIVTEFVRLQKLAACYEAGRRDCAPLDLGRRGR